MVPGAVHAPAAEGFCLARIVHHYRGFKAFAHLDEIHFLHYADMKRDLPGAMARIARILGLDVGEALLGELAAAAGFDNMKRNAEQFVPDAGRLEWRSTDAFFASGANAQWREVLRAEDLDLYDARMRELLPGDEIAWLQAGEG